MAYLQRNGFIFAYLMRSHCPCTLHNDEGYRCRLSSPHQTVHRRVEHSSDSSASLFTQKGSVGEFMSFFQGCAERNLKPSSARAENNILHTCTTGEALSNLVGNWLLCRVTVGSADHSTGRRHHNGPEYQSDCISLLDKDAG